MKNTLARYLFAWMFIWAAGSILTGLLMTFSNPPAGLLVAVNCLVASSLYTIPGIIFFSLFSEIIKNLVNADYVRKIIQTIFTVFLITLLTSLYLNITGDHGQGLFPYLSAICYIATAIVYIWKIDKADNNNNNGTIKSPGKKQELWIPILYRVVMGIFAFTWFCYVKDMLEHDFLKEDFQKSLVYNPGIIYLVLVPTGILFLYYQKRAGWFLLCLSATNVFVPVIGLCFSALDKDALKITANDVIGFLLALSSFLLLFHPTILHQFNITPRARHNTIFWGIAGIFIAVFAAMFIR